MARWRADDCLLSLEARFEASLVAFESVSPIDFNGLLVLRLSDLAECG